MSIRQVRSIVAVANTEANFLYLDKIDDVAMSMAIDYQVWRNNTRYTVKKEKELSV